jgi:NADH dehydrogenase
VRACEAHDVDRLVHLSALGADSTGRTEYLRAKGRAEELVRDAEVGWTIFRPSVVFGEGGEFVEFTATLTPPVVAPLPGGGKTRFQPIWVGDLVEMLADAVEGGHEGQTHEVGGPEVLSLADVARMVRRSKGSSVTILPVPMALADVGLSLAEPVPFLPFGRDQARSLRLDNVTDENDVTAFGVDPAELRTLAAYLGLESS